MSGWIESHRCMVTAWDCDHQGHMNAVRYYAMFDQAGWHMIQRAGGRIGAGAMGFVDIRVELDFLGEMMVNDPVLIESGVEGIGRTSLTYRSRMSNAATGAPTARARCTTVCFDLAARRKRPIPDDVRAGLETLLLAEA